MTTFVSVLSRGTIALPADLRRRHGLDHKGAQVEITEREDGVIELHPHVAIPSNQAWFWTDRWQAMEREVDEHVAKGEVIRHADPDEMFNYLDEHSDKG